jgi:hypothetical protein
VALAASSAARALGEPFPIGERLSAAGLSGYTRVVSFRDVTSRKDRDEADRVGTTPLGVPTAAGGQPRFELRVFFGDEVETHVLPFAGGMVIGRSRAADIFIDDASVSRRHALLHVGSTLLVQDLGSQNGTRVGAALLTPGTNATLAPGVPFVVGAITVVVEPISREAPGVAPAKPPRELGDTNAPPTAPRPSLRDEVARLERARILDALAECGGNQTKAAVLLGIPRRTLVLRLAEYAIPRPRK